MEKWKRVMGAIAAGKLAMEGVPDAHAEPLRERIEHRAEPEADLVWAQEAKAEFDVAFRAGNVEGMADVIRTFVQEYRHPTRGDIKQSAQHNPMRVMGPSEWRYVRSVAMHFMVNASSWGKAYPGLERQVTDVMVRIDEHLDEPGPTNTHKNTSGPQGRIDRSLGYK